jgi:cyanate permease
MKQKIFSAIPALYLAYFMGTVAYRNHESKDTQFVILFACLSALNLIWAIGCFLWSSQNWFKWFKIGLGCAAAVSIIIEFIYHD